MSFIHDYSDCDWQHIVPTRLHAALDQIFYSAQDFLILWGLNCRFPLTDIGRYVAWEFGLIYRDLNPAYLFSSVREVSDFEKRKFKI